MKPIRILIFIGGLVTLAFAFGFIFRIPIAISLWPWEDGRYSYLFIGSILAAVSAAMIWIGWTGELGALPAGSLNILMIGIATAIYFFQPSLPAYRSNLFSYGLLSLAVAVTSGAAFLWSRQFQLTDPRTTPMPVRISFGIFVAALVLAGGALILHAPIFPWDLNPGSSVIFGCIFLGDAFYFLYGLLYPRWYNALGQLLSFLAYDLVLIVPFVLLFSTVKPGRTLNLVVYIAVLVYSGGLAVYYLFINPRTRLGS